MLEQLITKIENMSRKRLEITRPAGEPDHVYLILNHEDGTATTCEATPHPRRAAIGSVKSLVDLACDAVEAGESVEIWYNFSKATLLIGDSRRSRSIMHFLTTQAWDAVCGIENTTWMDQRTFIRYLKINLGGLVQTGILDAARQVRFVQGADAQTAITPNKMSVGKTIMSEYTGQSLLPETVDLFTTVFSNIRKNAREIVRCHIEVDPAAERFRIVTANDAILTVRESMMDEIEKTILDTLGEDLVDQVKVYRGEP